MTIEIKPGQVITFYSYKGGTGRTMALANIACLLARRRQVEAGRRVLMIDWDLEAPGLHRFFYPKQSKRTMRNVIVKDEKFEKLPGLIDLFIEIRKQIEKVSSSEKFQSEDQANHMLENFDLEPYIRQTEVRGVYLLKAGRFDKDYSKRVNTFNWEDLFNLSPWLFRLFAEKLAERYEYVLIDSRTGITDTSGICTMIMPDKLVIVFVPNQQSLTGISELIHQAIWYRNESDDLRSLIIYPLPSRIEADQPTLREKWRFGDEYENIAGYQPIFEKLISEEYQLETCNLSGYFDNVQVQHVPYYSYGEKIAAIEEREDSFSIVKSFRNFMNLLVGDEPPWEMEIGDYISGSIDIGEISSSGIVIGSESHVTIITAPQRQTPLQLPPVPKHFVNREFELENILKQLAPGVVITLYGPGGIGKTALAAEAIRILTDGGQKLPDAFPDGIVFHTFYNQPQAELALENIAMAYGEELRPTPTTAAQRALSGRQALLILDGTEVADDLEAILNIRGRCGVLITSRDRAHVVDMALNISPFGLDVSMALLQAMGEDLVTDNEAAQRVCEMLGGLPLAIQIAGRYLATYGEDIATYASWLEKTPLNALEMGERRNQSVSMVIERSVDQLDEKTKTTLAVVGQLSMAPFERGAVAAGQKQPETTTDRSLGILVRYGLINRDGKRYIASHALIRMYARQRLEPPGDSLKNLATYYMSLAQSAKRDDHQGYVILDETIPHILHILEQLRDACQWNIVNDLAIAVEDYLDLRGRWRELLQVCNLALEASEKLDDHRSESIWLANLGSTFHALGQLDQANEKYQQALALSLEVGDRHGEGFNLNNLGTACASLGMYEQAIEYYQQALSIAREIGDLLGEGNRLGNLGLTYASLGQYEQAIVYYQQALAIARKIGDRRGEGNHLSSLGSAYSDMGQFDKSIEYYEQALAIARKIGDRRSEGVQLGDLGKVYADLGEYERSVKYCEMALDIVRQISDRRAEGSNLDTLGEVYYALGDYNRAKENYEMALAIRKDILSEDHPAIANSFNNIGLILASMGDYSAARPYYEQALIIRREIFGDKHPDTARSLNNLGTMLQAMGDQGAARTYYEQALAIYREALGERHPDTALCYNNLGHLLQAMGDLSAARIYYEQGLAIHLEVFGMSHPSTAISLNNLGLLLQAIGDFDGARNNFEKALKILQKALPPDHPQRITVQSNVSNSKDDSIK